MLNFSKEKNQTHLKGTPIPAGSIVKVKLQLHIFENNENPYISESSLGLRSLFGKFEVYEGTFKGRAIWDNLWLPQWLQEINLNEGQLIACERGGAMIKAILATTAGFLPGDESENAGKAFEIEGFEALNGKVFPVQVGIKRPVEKNGKIFWNNSIYRIITLEDPQYPTVMAKGEIISQGPVSYLPFNNEEASDSESSHQDSRPEHF